MSTSKIKWFDLFIFKGSKVTMFIIVVCLLMSSFLGFQMPKLIAELGRNYSVRDLFYRDLLYLAIVLIGVYCNRVLFQLSINKFVKLLTQNIRSLCYNNWILNYDIQTEEEDKSERYPQGEVIARIMNDSEALRDLVTSGTLSIFIDLFFVFANLISFIQLNRFSGIFLGVSEVIAAILLVWGSKYMRIIFLSVRDARGAMSKTVANLIGGVHETYYTNHENYASKKGEVVFDDFLVKQLKSNIWDAGYFSIAESLYPLLLALIVFIFPYSQITEAAIIFAIVDLVQRSIRPIKDVSGKIANIQRSYTGLIRVSSFIGDFQFSQNRFEKIDFLLEESKINKINFNHMEIAIPSFQYEVKDGQKPFSLKDIHFSVKKGDLIGVVGMSGSGKTTLLGIITASILAPQFSIKLSYGSEVVMDFSGDDLDSVIPYRQQVSIVSQESHLFSESLEFNISLTNEKRKDFKEFWFWIEKKIPYLKEWGIMPDDILDPKEISLGQKQLLCGIRSCYLKKPIVLFDEISSGLDADLELALRKVVLLIQENSMTFIVTHRPETIINSSKILVMDNGRLKDYGKHVDLMERSTIYRQFLQELMH